MNKTYVFNGDSYYDLASLGEAYSKEFDKAAEDIYSNTKEFISFLKSRINDKATIKRYVDILSHTKYKNNALTFLIFEMSDHKDVVISGVKLDLFSYIQALKENPNPENNILFGFLEDKGISETYAKMGADPKLCNHAEAMEKNFRNPFTYNYLTNFYGYEVKESIENKIRSIAINGEECFRRASNLAHTKEFQVDLAHRGGFTESIEAFKDEEPIFYSAKILKKKGVDEESLRKIFDKSFFWWMLDNFDKYDYKGKSSRILKKYQEIRKEYDKYLDAISTKKIQSIGFEYYVDLSRELYHLYLCFISFYHNDLIVVKRKFDPEKYAPDKPYCKTYITQDFMTGKVVKLYDPNPVKQIRTNPLTGETIEDSSEFDALDDVSQDKPELIMPEEASKPLDYAGQEKKLNRATNFVVATAVLSLLGLLVTLAMAVSVKFLSGLGKFKGVFENFDILNSRFSYGMYASFFALVLIYVAAAILRRQISSSYHSLHSCERLENGTDIRTLNEEERAEYHKKRDALVADGFRAYGFLLGVIFVCLSVMISYATVELYAVASGLFPQLPSFKASFREYGIYASLYVPAIFAVLLAMIKSRKSVSSAIMVTVLSFVVTVLILITA